MKAADLAASSIRFGVELETKIPERSGVSVGAYHGGCPVTFGFDVNGNRLNAPTFAGNHWRADRDGSIAVQSGERACEFVSPILHGEEGVEALFAFIEWLNAIGAKVDRTCGCHITVGIESVIGSTNADEVSMFVRKLAHIGHWHARSLYGQTGSGRHLNHYSHTFAQEVSRHMRRVVRASDMSTKQRAAAACGRGMINFQKVFVEKDGRYHGAVEFRVFAGTTSAIKVLHHLATVLGLCRRAHQVKCLGGFKKNLAQQERTKTAQSAVRFLWDFLGWTGGLRPVALGTFGRLHRDNAALRQEADRLCAKFDQQFPDAAL